MHNRNMVFYMKAKYRRLTFFKLTQGKGGLTQANVIITNPPRLKKAEKRESKFNTDLYDLM